MTGAPDNTTVAARRAMLDILIVLEKHRHSLVVCGGQAIFLQTPDFDLGVAANTKDADLAVDPGIGTEPEVRQLLLDAGFTPHPSWPGNYERKQDGARLDLVVPERVAGAGRRSAHVPSQRVKFAGRAKGLEGTLVDYVEMVVDSLDPADPRSVTVRVAGPAALVVAKAKVHKISERCEEIAKNRKDIEDVLTGQEPAEGRDDDLDGKLELARLRRRADRRGLHVPKDAARALRSRRPRPAIWSTTRMEPATAA
jgi:hypothetical protein